jgi:hypothetical protein
MIRLLFPEHVLFFNPNISVRVGFLKLREMSWVFFYYLLFLKAFEYFNDTTLKKKINSTTFEKKNTSLQYYHHRPGIKIKAYDIGSRPSEYLGKLRQYS